MDAVAASPLAAIEEQIGQATQMRPPGEEASSLLSLSEQVLEAWVRARGDIPTMDLKEGFRLIALHRQGARGEPSFNACRETVREIAYHYNLIAGEPEGRNCARHVAMMRMLARHLCLFVAAKLETSGIGEFCCSSKPLRSKGG